MGEVWSQQKQYTLHHTVVHIFIKID